MFVYIDVVADPHYSIKAVSKMTGLSPHVIRVWEKRYGAVKPMRTSTNRRLYSPNDAERLVLLRNAILAGHSIGNVFALPNEQLKILAAGADTKELGAQAATGKFARAIQAVRAMDASRLLSLLESAIVDLGQHGLLEKFIAPLTHRIGELWQAGEISAAHEHFASAIIRDFLARNSRPFAWTSNRPTLIVATPSGQLHELGAVLVGAAANDVGWRVVYLGTSLPAAEIAGAAVQNKARAVALSIVYPEDDPLLGPELENLRRYLPADVAILAGGRASGSYASTLARIGAKRQGTLREFYPVLEGLRNETPGS